MSVVKQISVFLENKPGRLARVTKMLGEAKVNIRAFMVAEAGEFGMIRVIVDDPERAMDLLSTKGMICRAAEVVCVEIPDEVGQLARISGLLSGKSVNIDYAYAFMTGSGKAVIVLSLDDAPMGVQVLGKEYRLLGPGDIRAV